ncbi:hypothetical protein NEUTE1DRAFT_32801, partial [Neurospora tetrasperma FGSC 2508]
PVLFIKKLGSRIYIYINYGGVNNITFKLYYLFPFIKEILNTICYIKIFTKFDI